MFRICFRKDHVGQAQATTAGHTYQNNQIPEIFFRFCNPKERNILNPGIFIFFTCNSFCEDSIRWLLPDFKLRTMIATTPPLLLSERCLPIDTKFLHACREPWWPRLRYTLWGEAKVPPFFGAPPFLLSIKLPPRQFQPPTCKLAPSKTHIGEGRCLCIPIQKLQIGGHESLFGGCQFTFWRVPIYILEAEIVYRQGVIPKKCGTLASCDPHPARVSRDRTTHVSLMFLAAQLEIPPMSRNTLSRYYRRGG